MIIHNQICFTVKFRLGYEGLYKKRTKDYYKEGEATFYKTSKFTLVDQSLNSMADLLNKVSLLTLDRK